MPLNRDFIGRTYDGNGTFEVGREHIRRFAQAIGDTNPAYVDPAAAKALGHPDVIAPPTFLTTVGMSLSGSGPISDPGPRPELRARRPRRAAVRPPPPGSSR